MGILTGITKSLAGSAYQLSFQNGNTGIFQEGSLYIILQYAQAFLQLLTKD